MVSPSLATSSSCMFLCWQHLYHCYCDNFDVKRQHTASYFYISVGTNWYGCHRGTSVGQTRENRCLSEDSKVLQDTEHKCWAWCGAVLQTLTATQIVWNKFILIGHEGPEGEQMYASTLPSTSALDENGWSTPRPLPHYPRERPGPHCMGGWVGSRAGLDGCGKSRPHRDSIPGPSSP